MLNSMEGKTSYFIQLLVTSCWIPSKAWRCIVRSNVWWCRIGRQCHRDQADQTRWCHASTSKWGDVGCILMFPFPFFNVQISRFEHWTPFTMVSGWLFVSWLRQSLPMETLVLSSKFWLPPSNCTFSSSTCMIVCHSKKIQLKLAVCQYVLCACFHVTMLCTSLTFWLDTYTGHNSSSF